MTPLAPIVFDLRGIAFAAWALADPPARQAGPHTFRKLLNPVQYLTQHGYTYWISYDPGSRFWPFQGIEAGWLLAVSVLLTAATVWLVRRRAA